MVPKVDDYHITEIGVVAMCWFANDAIQRP
jgi:hypothetical protein